MPRDTPNLEGALEGLLEEDVLAAICWHDELAPLLAGRIDPNIFATRVFQRIAKKAIDYLIRYNKPPTVHLSTILEPEINRREGSRPYRDTIERMRQIAPQLNQDFVLEQIDEFIERQELMRSLESALDKLMANDLAGAKELIFDRSIKQNSDVGTFIDDPKRALAFLNEGESDRFSFGIDALDERGIHPARGTLAMLMGTAKSGKSWFLVNCGKTALLQHHPVLHISLENSERLTAKRYLQAMFGMTARQASQHRQAFFKKNRSGEFLDFTWEDVEAKGLQDVPIKELRKKVSRLKRFPKLLIKEFPTGSLTMTQLRLYLRSLKQQHNFVPHILIIDYPDLMQLDESNLRVSTGRLVTAIRGLCVEENIAGISVTQGNRASFKASNVHGGMVAEDYSKIGTADLFLILARTKKEKEIGTARVIVEASREGADAFTVMITQSYGTGQFCLDSAFMGKKGEAAMEKVLNGTRADPEREEEEREADDDDAPKARRPR